jgi:site-specific DNA-methyltransferase (adenine-specific)
MMNLQLPPHYCKTLVMRSVLVHADCFDVFPYIDDKSVNLILCDLPYGITAKDWDKILPMNKLWKEYERIIKDDGCIVLFAQGIFSHKLVMSNEKLYKYQWVWVKNQPSGITTANIRPMRNHEDILVFYKKQPTYNKQLVKSKITDRKTGGKNGKHKANSSDVHGMKIVEKKNNPDNILKDYVNPRTVIEYDIPPLAKGRLHQNQKPLDLCKMLISTYSNEDDVVMDNCMGSNTTGLACKQLNRQYIGIEKDKNYYDVSVSRVLS